MLAITPGTVSGEPTPCPFCQTATYSDPVSLGDHMMKCEKRPKAVQVGPFTQLGEPNPDPVEQQKEIDQLKNFLAKGPIEVAVVDDETGEKVGTAVRAPEALKRIFQPEQNEQNDQVKKLESKAAARELVDRAVFVNVIIGKPGIRRKVSSALVSFKTEQPGVAADATIESESDGVDKTLIGVSKKLLDCLEYRKIQTLDGQIKKYISSRCFASPVRGGVYLLPIKLIEEVDKRIDEFREQRKNLIGEFLAIYPQRVQEALERLGSIGDKSDYPPVAAVKQAFSFDVQYVSFGVPAVLGNVNQAIFQREQERAEKQFIAAIDEVRDGLRTGMAELVAHMVDRLKGDRVVKCDDCQGSGKVAENDSDKGCPTCEGSGELTEAGKPKRFTKSLVTNMTDFLAVFDARNLANDNELSGLVGQARKLMEGADAETLREDSAYRDKIANGFAEIKTQLDGMIVSKPTRAIFFDD